MKLWRLLGLNTHDAFANMAIDEAVLQAVTAKKVPNTLRLYRWAPSAVSIGRFQSAYNEVDLKACETLGVNVVRRISGGGAVYHDSEGEVTYSVAVRRADLGTDDVAEAYRRICNGVIQAIRDLGVDAEYGQGNVRQCPNITIENRKVSGSAQAQKKGTILQHGTLLVDVDLTRMFTFLKVPGMDTRAGLLSIARGRITSIAEERGECVPRELVGRALVRGFEEALRVSFVEEQLSDYELDLSKALETEKYSTRLWNLEGKMRLPKVAKSGTSQ